MQTLVNIADLVRHAGRVNANQLGALYAKKYREPLDYRALGFRKLGLLLEQGEGELWRLERVAPRCEDGWHESGALYVVCGDAPLEQTPENAYVLGCYHYCSPRWTDEARDATVAWQRALAASLRLKGRIRVACEGVNATVSGSPEDLRTFIDALGYQDYSLEPCGRRGAWRALQVWSAPEICGLGCDVDQQRHLDHVGPGTRLEPADFDAALRRARDAVLVDVRNRYETTIGTFAVDDVPTLDPGTRHFSDFPRWLDNNLDALRGKDVFMACTGGIRCERASALVKDRLGTDRVFHLHGGIVKYMAHVPSETSLFKGKNYIFDRRANNGPHPQATDDILGRCLVCVAQTDSYRGRRRCASCHTLVLVCDACRDSGADKALTLTCDLCATQRR